MLLLTSVRPLPARSNSVVFSQVPNGHAFRFYGQVYFKTSEEIAFSMTTREEVCFNQGGNPDKYGYSRFQQHASVIPLGAVIGFDLA